jgi:hypothetical protein
MSKLKPTYDKSLTPPRFDPIVPQVVDDPQLRVLLNNLTRQMNDRLSAINTRLNLLEGSTADVIFVDTLGNELERLTFERGTLQDENS